MVDDRVFIPQDVDLNDRIEFVITAAHDHVSQIVVVDEQGDVDQHVAAGISQLNDRRAVGKTAVLTSQRRGLFDRVIVRQEVDLKDRIEVVIMPADDDQIVAFAHIVHFGEVGQLIAAGHDGLINRQADRERHLLRLALPPIG